MRGALARVAVALATGCLATTPGCGTTQDPRSIPVCDSVDVNCRCMVAGWQICGHVCADLQYDPAHCGSCDATCPSQCVAGKCADGCGALLTCGGRCVTGTDPLNCGSCGNQCNGGQVCAAGVCKTPDPTCSGGKKYCAGGCTDISSDVFNCGGCNMQCPDVLGICYKDKAGVYWCCRGKLCGGKCVDTKSDPLNCGDCGIECQNSCSFGNCS